MLNNAVRIFVFLILTLILTNHGLSEETRQIEMKLSVFPETIAFGDTCYVLVTVFNQSKEMATVTVPCFRFAYFDDVVQFNLRHQDKTWRGAFECLDYLEPERMFIDAYAISSGESVTFLAVALQFPPLEDLYQDDFWSEIREKLKENPEGLSFDFGIEFSPPRMTGTRSSERARLTQEVKITLRNDKEMAMIDQWYRNTPKDLFPKFVKGEHLVKAPTLAMGQRRAKQMFAPEPWYPWLFVSVGNRFPGDPNYPATWQGWQELEESVTPSTMRDEIRLTRILIQYCDTEDDAVLKELKEWFDNMNEVQRTVMAKSLHDRTYDSRGTKFLLLFREIYKAIREYDVVPITERNKERLRALGLIE